jgi:N-acetylmuramoyl-L-alanine amidase
MTESCERMELLDNKSQLGDTSESDAFSRAVRSILLISVAIILAACAGTQGGGRVRDNARTFKTVIIDAGHGDFDSGARTRKGVLEKNLALDVALKVAPKLQAAGFRTILTRRSDVFVHLEDRAKISNRYPDAVFVSIHFNDAGRKPVMGIESYYISPESRQMAERMVHMLASEVNMPDRGARVARFRVLRSNENPAVLMECGYLTSAKEASLIVQDGYRERIAQGIAKGLIAQRGGPLLQLSAQ